MTVETGKIYCLLGASGSGKTTLLRIIMGAISSDKGQNLTKEKILKSSEELLQVVGLQSDKNKLIINCSGGMKKRASLATTMIHNPKILILDEPTVPCRV